MEPWMKLHSEVIQNVSIWLQCLSLIRSLFTFVNVSKERDMGLNHKSSVQQDAEKEGKHSILPNKHSKHV